MITFSPTLGNQSTTSGNRIIVCAHHDDKTLQIPTDIFVQSSHWNESKGIVETSDPNFVMLNLKIQQFVKRLEGLQIESVLKGTHFDLNDLQGRMNEILAPVLVDFMKNAIVIDTTARESTKKAWRDTLEKIRVFNSSIRVDKVDYDFIERFDRWLRSRSLSQNTIHKHHKHLKKFLNLAIKKKHLSRNRYPYAEFRVALEKVDRPALSADELERLKSIESVSFPDSSYEQVLDMFLLSCYTGLRLSDVKNLSTDHITKTPKGYRIDIKTQKAGKMARLPLYLMFPESKGKWTKPESIIRKYHKGSNQKTLFASITDRIIGLRLQELGRKAGIEKRITFHMGRHTFGTIMAMKVPLPVLQRLMQHSNVNTTMIYVNMNKELIDKSLEGVEW